MLPKKFLENQNFGLKGTFEQISCQTDDFIRLGDIDHQETWLEILEKR